MSEPGTGTSRTLRVALVLATFVVLAAIGWGASVGVRWFERAQGSRSQTAAPAVVLAPIPEGQSASHAAAAVEARFEEQRAKLEADLDAAAREVEDEPVRVGGEVTRPVKIAGGEAKYTEPARRARLQGVVILEATIDREGRVTDTRVLKGLPFGLDESARRAVSGWRFTPAMRNGRPVAALFTITVDFRLR